MDSTLSILLRAADLNPSDWMTLATKELTRKQIVHNYTKAPWTQTNVLAWAQKHGRELAAAVAAKYKCRIVPAVTLYRDIVGMRKNEKLTYPQIAKKLIESKVIPDQWFSPHPQWNAKTVARLIERVERKLPKNQIEIPAVTTFTPSQAVPYKAAEKTTGKVLITNPAVVSNSIVNTAMDKTYAVQNTDDITAYVNPDRCYYKIKIKLGTVVLRGKVSDRSKTGFKWNCVLEYTGEEKNFEEVAREVVKKIGV